MFSPQTNRLLHSRESADSTWLRPEKPFVKDKVVEIKKVRNTTDLGSISSASSVGNNCLREWSSACSKCVWEGVLARTIKPGKYIYGSCLSDCNCTLISRIFPNATRQFYYSKQQEVCIGWAGFLQRFTWQMANLDNSPKLGMNKNESSLHPWVSVSNASFPHGGALV